MAFVEQKKKKMPRFSGQQVKIYCRNRLLTQPRLSVMSIIKSRPQDLETRIC